MENKGKMDGMAPGLAMSFIAGAALGLGIGFLLAPRPGVETRKMLKEKAMEAKQKAIEVGEKAGTVVHEAKEKAVRTAENVAEHVEQAVGKVHIGAR